MPISARKDYDIRKRVRETVDGLRQAWDAVVKKAKSGETLRDEDLRFLRNIPELLTTLEEKIAESLSEDTQLPEGKLRTFIERTWKLNRIGKLEQVIEATGYYRCQRCGECHLLGRDCFYDEYQKMNKNGAGK